LKWIRLSTTFKVAFSVERNPLISVIIPTYNRCGWIEGAVESVLLQSFDDAEIIVVDDGSCDSTPERIGRLTDRYADRRRIRYRSTPHSGVSAARNRGIEMAEGEWIAFLDSDDYWLPDKLTLQIRYLASHPAYLICHTDEIWIRDGVRINQGKKHRKHEGWFFVPSLDLCLISPSSVMMHRSVFEEVGMFDETFPVVEDYELWLRVTSRYPVGYLHEKLVVKRGGHADQLSSTIDGIEGHRLRALEKLMRSGNLTPPQFDLCLETFRRKAVIYIDGCRKRSKQREIEELRSHLEELERIGREITIG
jgi:glycosyltransferase involved in cell wall biosynthesis